MIHIDGYNDNDISRYNGAGPPRAGAVRSGSLRDASQLWCG